MRRIVIPAGLLVPSLLIGLGSAGCSNFRDLFSAHADVAAEAGGQELPADAPRRPIMAPPGKACSSIARPRTSSRTSGWTTRCSGQAVAQGKLPLDSASVDRGGVARDLRDQGHAVARHPDGPARHLSRLVGRQPLPGARPADDPAHPLRGPGQRGARGQAIRRSGRRRQALAKLRKGGADSTSSPRTLSAGCGQRGRQRLPAAQPARSVRSRVRQRGVVARAGAGERRRRDAVRLPHHQAPDPRRGA